MENAIDNGVRLRLGCEVYAIEQENKKASILVTNQGKIRCEYLIDAAGLYADEVAEMLDDEFFTIHPRRGTIVIYDKENKGKIHTFSGQTPGSYTKGGGPQETPEGTLLFGPSAKEVPEKDDFGVDQDDLDFVVDKGCLLYTSTMNPRAKVRVEEIDDFLKQYRNKMKIKPEANPVFVFESEGTLKKELLAKVREIIKNIHKLEK